MKFKDIPLCNIESLDTIDLNYVYPIYLNANLNDLIGSGIVYIEGILKNGRFRITSLNLTLHPEDKNLKPLKFYKEQ